MTGQTTRRGLIGAALTGAVVGASAPFKLPEHLDAKLLAQCDRFIHLKQESDRLCLAIDRSDGAMPGSGIRQLQADFDAVSAEEHRLGEEIANTAPRTVDGVQAKARAALIYVGSKPPSDMIGRMQHAILSNLADGGLS